MILMILYNKIIKFCYLNIIGFKKIIIKSNKKFHKVLLSALRYFYYLFFYNIIYLLVFNKNIWVIRVWKVRSKYKIS
jgi:hypothetical protein